MIKTVAKITSVERRTTRQGKSFSVIFDDAGKEYTSWADPLTFEAEGFQGQVVQLGFDETTKGQYVNRTLRFIQETGAGDSGTDFTNGGSDSESVSHPSQVDVQVPSTVQTVGAADGGDWLQVVRNTARRGEWRAAEALQRREDIRKSVALKAALDFIVYIPDEDRTPENIDSIYKQMLEILA